MARLIDIIEWLDGAGLVITDMELIEEDLKDMGFDPETEVDFINDEDTEERELDPDDESQCLDCLHDFSECTCDKNDLP